MDRLPEEIIIKIAEYHHQMMMIRVRHDIHYYWKDQYYIINKDIYTNKKLDIILSI
jgi:hypothetical protein